MKENPSTAGGAATDDLLKKIDSPKSVGMLCMLNFILKHYQI